MQITGEPIKRQTADTIKISFVQQNTVINSIKSSFLEIQKYTHSTFGIVHSIYKIFN